MSSLDELIAKAKAEVETPSEAPLSLWLGGEVVVFVFVAFDPRDWLDITAVHPPRKGSTLDERFGYNSATLTEDAAPLAGFRFVDGERIVVSDEEWGDLFGYKRDEKTGEKIRKRGVLSAEDRKLIHTVLWGLNVYEPNQRVLEAKKALAAKPQKKRPSRAKSASPRAV